MNQEIILKKKLKELNFISKPKNKKILESHILILIDWLNEFCYEFDTSTQSFIQCIFIFNHYLKKYIAITDLQHVGSICYFLSLKLSDEILPQISDIIYLNGYNHKKNDYILIEKDILKTLNWKIHFYCPIYLMSEYLLSISKKITGDISNTKYFDDSFLKNYQDVLYKKSFFLSEFLIKIVLFQVTPKSIDFHIIIGYVIKLVLALLGIKLDLGDFFSRKEIQIIDPIYNSHLKYKEKYLELTKRYCSLEQEFSRIFGLIDTNKFIDHFGSELWFFIYEKKLKK